MTDTTDALTWSDEPPEAPAWYWKKSPITGNASIWKVKRDPKGGGLYATPFNGTGFHFTHDETHASQWAGPIPEPDEPSDTT